MKDKEKQINELVNLLDNENVSVSHWDYYNDDFNKNYRKEIKDVAKIVINAGYRKLPKDSVVLSRGEYEKLTTPKLFVKQKPLSEKEFAEKLKNEKYGIISADECSIEMIPSRQEIEKETAGKFAKALKDKYGKSASEYYPILITLTSEDLDTLAKQFGIEIKE